MTEDFAGRMAGKRDDTRVPPVLRARVETLMREQWQEPVIVLRLADTALGFAVPGRRADGTVEGSAPAGRFFTNVLRGVGGAAVYVLALVSGGGSGGGKAGGPFDREVRVTGPENALVLGLTDELRSVKSPWLAVSPSGAAVVDTGSPFTDPADAPAPRIAWQARGAERPAVGFRERTLTWPDGSRLRFELLGRTEDRHLRQYFEAPDVVHWTGRPG